MPVPLFLKLSAAIIFGIQFLIFAYLYSSHRVPFFRYLVWAWGLFVVAKVSAVSVALVPDASVGVLAFVADFDGMLADLAVLAAALAFGWSYRVRWQHALAGGAYAGLLTVLMHLPATAAALTTPIRMLGGATFVAAGAAFWVARSRTMSCRAARFLAGSLGLWGAYRMVFPFVEPPPGTDAYLAGHMVFMLFYFLSVFAIIIMVLDRARREMAALVEFNETLVDGLGEGVQLVDESYTIQHANRWLADQFGPVAGRRCYEVLTADGQQCPGCPMTDRARMTAPVRLEVAGPEGRRFLLTCSALRRPDGRVSLLELVADVTEQERLRARLAEAERLAAVGELAASVAHEIRNPLAAIVNAASLLEQEETLTAGERTGTLDAVKKETRRLNGILSDFLAFARPREVKRLKGDIRQVVDHVAALVRENPACAEGARTIVDVDPKVPPFAFDADQLTQVLWNVAINGMQAMDGCGELRINVGRDNGEVVITVSDTGRGIPLEDRQRVFEPFYSKKRGGTGLGLSIARRIIAAHGGRIDVESTVGWGSRFMIHLPVDGVETMATILVVDDEPSARTTLALLMSKRGHQVTQAEGVQAATKALADESFDVVVTDLRMPDGDGLEVLRTARAHAPDTAVIILTAYAGWESAKEAMQFGAFDYFEKGREPDELLHRIGRALGERSLRRENENLRGQVRERFALTGLIARSAEMRRVLDLIARVAPTDATVLIQGESGTGKELIAKALHHTSRRADGPFVAVNCGALPETLLESEIFGHVKGAFTGATVSKRGLFEEAHGGTFLLDEVGEMSPSLQVKLLRALQDGEVRRVGANQPTIVDARVVAATNRDLQQRVREGAFREDLFYRLNVIPVTLPPLRERREDIPLLAETFLERMAQKQGRTVRLSADAIECLLRYPWPGNVRELENVMERTAILTARDVIGGGDLPAHIAAGIAVGAAPNLPTQEGLAEVERVHILQTLERVGWNHSRAAEILKIGRTTLWRKLKEYGLAR